ncbi:antitoxin [Alkanindiges illinoisensis]|uniref:antitoxin n=1 Tax=Alkanindiges illinoisensis TaxID=197183 RepID=UPI00047ED4D0|nr:AbrB/MazE/SpoVT family DNA-binding domain-containing protein [Alkanindiges illinoisensis]
MTEYITRVFKNGNSQAVRIPAELRLNSDRVQIFKNAQGDLVIHPIQASRGAAFMQVLQGFDDEFIHFMEQEQQEALPLQERETL